MLTLPFVPDPLIGKGLLEWMEWAEHHYFIYPTYLKLMRMLSTWRQPLMDYILAHLTELNLDIGCACLGTFNFTIATYFTDFLLDGLASIKYLQILNHTY